MALVGGDTRPGFERQIQKIASSGVLSTFLGMVTESRSIISFVKHEYFRRILCNVIGDLVENGEYPNDWDTLKEIVSNICYNNAYEYLFANKK